VNLWRAILEHPLRRRELEHQRHIDGIQAIERWAYQAGYEQGFNDGYYDGREDQLSALDEALRDGVDVDDLLDMVAAARAVFDQRKMELCDSWRG
jgi:hypothetical protein